MSHRHCIVCGDVWNDTFNFCPRDGGTLMVAPTAAATEVPDELSRPGPSSPPETRAFGNRPTDVFARRPADNDDFSLGRAELSTPLVVVDPELAALAFPTSNRAGPAATRPEPNKPRSSRVFEIPRLAGAPAAVGDDDEMPVFVGHKRRNAAAFSDTACFRRPIDAPATELAARMARYVEPERASQRVLAKTGTR